MLSSVCRVCDLEYNAKGMRPSTRLANCTYHIVYRIVTLYWDTYRIMEKCVAGPCTVPSGSARDAVSIPREFNNEFANFKSKNEKRKSSKNESLIHSCYFGLNRRAIAVIKIATITELSTFFSYHSDHSDCNDQMETRLNWHYCKQSSLPHQICLRQFWPFIVWKVRPTKIFCGNPAMARPRSITGHFTLHAFSILLCFGSDDLRKEQICSLQAVCTDGRHKWRS